MLDRAAGKGAVGNLLPAARARPGHRGEHAATAGHRVDRVLGRAEQQIRPGIRPAPARQGDHPGDVAVVPDAARGGDAVPPAAASPRGRSEPDQLLVRHLSSPAEIRGQFGQRLLHASQPKPSGPRRYGR